MEMANRLHHSINYPYQGAYGLEITATGSSDGESGSVSMDFDTFENNNCERPDVNQWRNCNTIRRHIRTDRKIRTDSCCPGQHRKKCQLVRERGQRARWSDIQFNSSARGRQRKVVQTWISAEQLLTVSKADSIICTAAANYGTLSSDLGIELAKGSQDGESVALNEYDGKAYASSAEVVASQTAAAGSGNSIKIYGHANDPAAATEWIRP